MAKPNPKVTAYIKKHLEKGIHIKKIKRTLAEAGHPIEAIEDAAEYVFQMNPHLKKKPKTMMVVYGLILIFLISALIIFAYFKLAETVEYVEQKGAVEKQIEKTRSIAGMSDQEIILYVARSEDMSACESITSLNIQYACQERMWETDPCRYKGIIGGSSDICYSDAALESLSLDLCYKIHDKIQLDACKLHVIIEIASQNAYDKCLGSFECLNYSMSLNIGSLDDAFCDNFMAEDSDQCRIEMAAAKSDESVCNLISLIENRHQCHEHFLSSMQEADAFCDEYIDYFKDSAGPDNPKTDDYARASCLFSAAFTMVEDGKIDCSQALAFVSTKPSSLSSIFQNLYKDMKQSDPQESEFLRC